MQVQFEFFFEKDDKGEIKLLTYPKIIQAMINLLVFQSTTRVLLKCEKTCNI